MDETLVTSKEPLLRRDVLEAYVKGILEAVGEDPSREGLERTPVRVARAWQFLTQGYNQDVQSVLNGAVFSERYRRDGLRFETPYDYHWDAHGHAVVAEAVSDWLAAER